MLWFLHWYHEIKFLVRMKSSPPVTGLQVLGLPESSTPNVTRHTIISSASNTWSLFEISRLPPVLADTTNSSQLLPRRCAKVWAQFITLAILIKKSGQDTESQLPVLQCRPSFWLWVTKVKFFAFKCHGGLWPWESWHTTTVPCVIPAEEACNGSRLDPHASP